jgi:dihydrofolate synthase/folylpolyglutamate synthase
VPLDSRLDEPIGRIYRQYNRRRRSGPDEEVRHPAWTRRMLERLGRPDDAYPVIMVTGSKGKGSTAYYLATILEAHGRRVGFFSSPHLLDNLERLRINRRAITADQFLAVYAQLAPVLDEVEAALPPDHYVGPVGIFAALAALWFRQEQVDVAVFETGRGARFDDVAEVHHVGAIVTSILLEHRRELGPDLDRIAWHKAGVVRSETAWAVVPDDARLARHLPVGPAIVRESAWTLADVRMTAQGTAFTVDTGRGLGRRLLSGRVPALAPFAAENARRALLAAARFLGDEFDGPLAMASLRAASFPGRAELWPGPPPLFLDGSVRRESVRSLLQGLAQARLLSDPVASVVAVPEDKDWEGVAAQVAPLGPLWFVAASNPRLHFPADPVRRFPGSRHRPTVDAALAEMRTMKPSLILALGTQSFVADVIRAHNDGDRLLDLTLPPPGGRLPDALVDKL